MRIGICAFSLKGETYTEFNKFTDRELLEEYDAVNYVVMENSEELEKIKALMLDHLEKKSEENDTIFPAIFEELIIEYFGGRKGKYSETIYLNKIEETSSFTISCKEGSSTIGSENICSQYPIEYVIDRILKSIADKNGKIIHQDPFKKYSFREYVRNLKKKDEMLPKIYGTVPGLYVAIDSLAGEEIKVKWKKFIHFILEGNDKKRNRLYGDVVRHCRLPINRKLIPLQRSEGGLELLGSSNDNWTKQIRPIESYYSEYYLHYSNWVDERPFSSIEILDLARALRKTFDEYLGWGPDSVSTYIIYNVM